MKVPFPFSWWIESLLNFECHKYKFIFGMDFLASTISNRFCEDPDFNKRFQSICRQFLTFSQRTKCKYKLVLNDKVVTKERAFFFFSFKVKLFDEYNKPSEYQMVLAY